MPQHGEEFVLATALLDKLPFVVAAAGIVTEDQDRSEDLPTAISDRGGAVMNRSLGSVPGVRSV